jgi:uncharacterized protein (DUF885 family)
MFGIWYLNFSGLPECNSNRNFRDFLQQFKQGYGVLNVPDFEYDYRNYFLAIPDTFSLNRQSSFMHEQENLLKLFDRTTLSVQERLCYDQIVYELDVNLKRIKLERQWVLAGRLMPEMGYFDSLNYAGWYEYFIQKFTGLNKMPVEVMQFGQKEVERINKQIDSIQHALQFKTRNGLYKAFKHDSFFYQDQKELLMKFSQTDEIIRSNLKAFCEIDKLPRVFPVQWPNADIRTPPGMYLSHASTAYRKDVFYYNFYGSRFRKRFAEWLYLHEAIPGHHLQASMRNTISLNGTQQQFLYPGTFEGWACYAENEGNSLGVYKDSWNYLGLLEWNLIRAVRIVLDAGIHYYGWSKEKSRLYWEAHCVGLDEFADREIERVIHWPSQALSYQMGAEAIRLLFNDYRLTGDRQFKIAGLRKAFLRCGMLPIPVIQKILRELNEAG